MVGTVVRVKGIQRIQNKKTGKIYCYHRSTGTRIKEEFGTPEFFMHLAELEAKASDLAEHAAKPNTLKALIIDYKQTDNFLDLAPRTRRDYEKVFTFLEPLYDANLVAFSTPQIVKLRNTWRKSRGRRFVNYVRAVLSILFGYAKELGLVKANPVSEVRQVRKPHTEKPLNRAWSLSEREAVLAALPAHLKLPVAIGLHTGMREGDVLKLPRNIVVDGTIAIITSKRQVKITLRVLPGLRQALKEAPEHDAITLCANSRGRPWTENGFRTSLFKQLKKLEAAGLTEPGLTFHGLRHTAASLLAEAGVSSEDIATVLGQRSSRMADHYSREADRSRRSKAAIGKLKPLQKSAK